MKSAELPTIRVEPELLERCRRKCGRTGVKLAFVVRQALAAWVEGDEAVSGGQIGAAYARSVYAPSEVRGANPPTDVARREPTEADFDDLPEEDVHELSVSYDENQPLEVEGEEGRTHARRRAK